VNTEHLHWNYKMVTGVKNQRSLNKKKHTLDHMRKRLLQLMIVDRIYQRSHISTLNKNQRIILELWEHIQGCRDKDCKRKHCQSSRILLKHYNHYKQSNKISTCILCDPVERQLERYCRGRAMNNQNCTTRKMKHMDQYPIKDHGNNTFSISNRQNQVFDDAKNSRIASICPKSRTLPHKHYRKTVRWDKSVKGGNKQGFSLHRHQSHYKNKQNLKVEIANEMWNLNHTIPSEKTPRRALVSNIEEAFANSAILEEKIVDASVILTKLKRDVEYNESMERVTQSILR